ncbi:MAG TPA: DUF2617 family protein [Lacipirellulaceae bacterium]|nr:DUF2617 family protein [Lacipirellulaceae bacterium]HMP04998.1 DUF2617 family protein [Lacipirellulaceae bacterium]
MISARPKIAELVYQLFARSLHPELVEPHQSCTIERGRYKATVQITSAGHVVSWQYGNVVLTEVAAGAQQPLPKLRRLMSYRLKGERNDRIEVRPGLSYEMQFALEPADREKFAAYQRELSLAGARRGMLQRFEPSGRLAAGALSYVNVDSRDKSLCVQAFHTFPDDCAVLKIQSWYRLGA